MPIASGSDDEDDDGDDDDDDDGDVDHSLALSEGIADDEEVWVLSEEEPAKVASDDHPSLVPAGEGLEEQRADGECADGECADEECGLCAALGDVFATEQPAHDFSQAKLDDEEVQEAPNKHPPSGKDHFEITDSRRKLPKVKDSPRKRPKVTESSRNHPEIPGKEFQRYFVDLDDVQSPGERDSPTPTKPSKHQSFDSPGKKIRILSAKLAILKTAQAKRWPDSGKYACSTFVFRQAFTCSYS